MSLDWLTSEAEKLFDDGVRVISETGIALPSMLSRKLRVGYNIAARLMDLLEERGYVGPFNNGNPRQILIREAVTAAPDKEGE